MEEKRSLVAVRVGVISRPVEDFQQSFNQLRINRKLYQDTSTLSTWLRCRKKGSTLWGGAIQISLLRVTITRW